MFTAINILIFTLIVYLQTSLLARFDIFGFMPNIILMLIVAFSLYRKTYEAYAFAFAAGLVLDILSAGPFGLHIAIFMAVVFVSGLVVDEDHTKISAVLAGTFLVSAALVFYLALWGIVSYQTKNFVLSGLVFSLVQAAFTAIVFFLVFPYLRKLFLWEEKADRIRSG